MLAAVTVTKKERVGEIPPLRGSELPVVPAIVATATTPAPAVRTVSQTFPPLRDAYVPMPVVMVQSRYGMGRSAKPIVQPSTRPIPANS